jgi:chromate reductase
MLAVAADRAPEGVEVELYDGLASIPPFNEDDEGARTPQAVLDLRARIAAADAILISTPEYNHSVPGVIKNAVDWASRPPGVAEIVGKPTAVMSSSLSTFGGVWAQAELRKSLAAAGARVHEEGVALSKSGERFDSDGRLLDAEVADQIGALIGDLKTLAEAPRDDW